MEITVPEDNTELNVEDSTDANQDTRSVEDLKRELAEVRREAAGRRVSNKAKDAELAEFAAWKESQKSELQRAQEAASTAKQERDALLKEKVQAKAAKDAGLDPALAHRIVGDTEEEMLEDAKLLAGATKRTTSAMDGFSGGKGEVIRPPANTAEEFNEWLRNSASGQNF